MKGKLHGDSERRSHSHARKEEEEVRECTHTHAGYTEVVSQHMLLSVLSDKATLEKQTSSKTDSHGYRNRKKLCNIQIYNHINQIHGLPKKHNVFFD